MLRCRDSMKAESMAKACEAAISNPCIGYDQSQRNTLNTQARLTGYDLARIKTPCECDCSSLMSVCAIAAGINIPFKQGNAPRTATMKTDFTSSGMFDVLTDNYYLTGDGYLKRGDILVKAGVHTVMVLENGNADKYPVLRKGAKGEYVRRLQSKLNVKGYPTEIDGVFGNKTQVALVKYQTAAFPGEPKQWDGICGPNTWKKLNS